MTTAEIAAEERRLHVFADVHGASSGGWPEEGTTSTTDDRFNADHTENVFPF